MGSSHWLAARVLLPVAVLLMAPAALVAAHRSATPCSGSLREITIHSTVDGEALPVVARPVAIGTPTRTPGFDTGSTVAGTDELGDFRLHWSFFDDRHGRSGTSFQIDDPLSCSGGSILYSTGAFADPTGIALRRSPAGGPYVVTWSEKEMLLDPQPVPRNAVFTVEPPGPLRRLRQYEGRLVVLLFGAVAAVLAWRRATRAAVYFGRGGLAAWRSGRVDERGWIAPEDGSPIVRAALSGIAPGTEVMFSTHPVARAWTFREVGTPSALAVVVGSPYQIEARYEAEAKGALLAAVLAVVVSGSALIALLR
jgi:hypothetical protein